MASGEFHMAGSHVQFSAVEHNADTIVPETAKSVCVGFDRLYSGIESTGIRITDETANIID